MKKNQELSLKRKFLKIQNLQFGREMRLIPREDWAEETGDATLGTMSAVWRSRNYCAQIHDDPGITRISVCKTALNKNGSWQDEISWSEMQRVKNECGYSEREAIEIFPPKADEVPSANLRHLWVLPEGERLPFSWKSGDETPEEAR